MADFLKIKGLDVVEANTCERLIHLFGTVRPDAAILDHTYPDGNAIDLLPKLTALSPYIPIIIVTGNASIDLAVRAMKEGAENFITKPVQLAALHAILERALHNQRVKQKEIANDSRQKRTLVSPFTGVSRSIRELEEQASRVLHSDVPVLIQGETGTGKGVLAKWIHSQSSRSDGPFVDLNCAGLAKDFLETELFGHEKGAFTSAVNAKPGLLEVAHHGTVFLDEIGDMDISVQPKLLKVLEEKQFRRMGEVRDRHVDVRLVSATHQDLAMAVRERRFREDLMFRVNTVALDMPPLRSRPEDIPALAQQLLDRLTSEAGRGTFELSPRALDSLQRHSWPGNVRELRNVLERAMLFSSGSTIHDADVQFSEQEASPDKQTSAMTLREVEQRHIVHILQQAKGHVASAAQILDIPVSSLYAKIKTYNITLTRSVLSGEGEH